MRPGRDAITPVMGPEMGLAGLGRAALGALGRGVTGMMTRRGESESAKRIAREEARKEPDAELPPQGSVFRSARPDAEAAKQAEYMRRVEELGLKKGGTAKAYAKGGSVRGSGCETRSKKTRYV